MGKDRSLCMCGFILRIHQCSDSHEDDGFAFHWSGQDGHQKIPNVLPVQLGVGLAGGLQGIGSQGNRWATNNAVVCMDGSGLPLFHHQHVTEFLTYGTLLDVLW